MCSLGLPMLFSMPGTAPKMEDNAQDVWNIQGGGFSKSSGRVGRPPVPHARSTAKAAYHWSAQDGGDSRPQHHQRQPEQVLQESPKTWRRVRGPRLLACNFGGTFSLFAPSPRKIRECMCRASGIVYSVIHKRTKKQVAVSALHSRCFACSLVAVSSAQIYPLRAGIHLFQLFSSMPSR